jgi:hypothetical protein
MLSFAQLLGSAPVFDIKYRKLKKKKTVLILNVRISLMRWHNLVKSWV